ncbi:MAG TPA: NAD(P)H-dependent glycerol-3-phosphate dehydrogenase [Planctomycetota bacterium]|nr:NAD(P)H-dependent glycerol-3-phosphate dehydrogenase [Planctomycetota bacterium]
MTRIVIIGDGAWGTALALVLERGGHEVFLWTRFPAYAAEMRAKRENVKFLPGSRLPDGVRVVSGTPPPADVYIAAVPTQFIRPTFTDLRGALPPRPLIACVAKGLEQSTGKRPSEILREALGPARIVALCGPSHAPEVAKGLPASLSAAGEPAAAKAVQALFRDSSIRVYTSGDRLGVELGAALKNVIALAAGISDGLGLGHNAKAALLTRGIVEMARLGCALGARRDTFFGLSGVGDLITTTTFPSGRNLSVGRALGEGKKLDDVLGSMNAVAEGVWTTKAALALAKRHGVDMPITEELHRILYEGKSARAALKDLMHREQKAEGAERETRVRTRSRK